MVRLRSRRKFELRAKYKPLADGFLAGAVFVGHYGWVSAGDVVMPAWGWLMLGLGVFFSLLVGGGLMALVFYSSREGFDEPPELAQKKKRRVAKWAKLVPTRKKPRSS